MSSLLNSPRGKFNLRGSAHRRTLPRARLRRRTLLYLAGAAALALLGLSMSIYLRLPSQHTPADKKTQGPSKTEPRQHKQLLEGLPTRAFCSRARPPLVCAHGGDTTHAPPNTAKAFQKALDVGADCVEVDATRTKDGELVVLHVRELQQLLGPKAKQRPGVQVGDFTWAELSKLSWPGGERVMKVADAVTLTSPFVGCVTLDVKTYQNKQGQPVDEDAIAEGLVRLVHETRCGNCMIWAKSDKVVSYIKALSPGQRAGYILMNETQEAVRAGMHEPLRMEEPEVVGAHHGMVDDDVASLLRERGKQLFTWTINDPTVMSRVLDVGVDALVTNHPQMAIQAIEARMSRCGEVVEGAPRRHWGPAHGPDHDGGL